MLVDGNLHMFTASNLSSRVCDHLKKHSAAKLRNKQITDNLAREEGLACIYIPPTSLSVSVEVKNITVKYCREAKISRPGRGLTDRVTGRQKWRNHQPGESIQGPRAAASVSKWVYCSQKLPEKLQRHTQTPSIHTHIHILKLSFKAVDIKGSALNCIYSLKICEIKAESFTLESFILSSRCWRL